MNIETLYDDIRTPHGLSARMYLETLRHDLTAARDDVEPTTERETVPSPFAETMRSSL